jgi:hypothetical protein
VFEKKEPTIKKTGGVKDGLHIMYPYLCLSTEMQLIIREKVIEYVTKKKIFESLPITNDINNVFDKSVLHSNGWLLYGSTKPGCTPYKLTKIYDHNMEEKTLEEMELAEADLLSELSIRKFSKEDIVKWSKEVSQEFIENNSKNLETKNESNNQPLSIEEAYNKIVIAKELLKFLNKKRADDYSDWLFLGITLKNIDDSLLTDWIEFSKQSSKFKKGECEKLWNNQFNKTYNYSMGSLMYWAKCDNWDGQMHRWHTF